MGEREVCEQCNNARCICEAKSTLERHCKQDAIERLSMNQTEFNALNDINKWRAYRYVSDLLMIAESKSPGLAGELRKHIEQQIDEWTTQVLEGINMGDGANYGCGGVRALKDVLEWLDAREANGE